MSERQVPFYCPYCGEEDLVPAGADAGGWECRSCTRAFTLRSLGSPGSLGSLGSLAREGA